jgi:hypothetical protein
MNESKTPATPAPVVDPVPAPVPVSTPKVKPQRKAKLEHVSAWPLAEQSDIHPKRERR